MTNFLTVFIVTDTRRYVDTIDMDKTEETDQSRIIHAAKCVFDQLPDSEVYAITQNEHDLANTDLNAIVFACTMSRFRKWMNLTTLSSSEKPNFLAKDDGSYVYACDGDELEHKQWKNVTFFDCLRLHELVDI